MSYKDEYEVARLYCDPQFRQSLAEQFEGWDRLDIHLAPPVAGAGKRRYGPWLLALMPLLARLKVLRGTRLDPFGQTAERRTERSLIVEFEAVIDRLARDLTPANHALAVEIASLPRQIRGFGHIKAKAVAEYRARLAECLAHFRSDPQQPRVNAAE